MAFPLAHPAAVLPLRRFCPRWLSFPALVVGSVCPDAAYLLQRIHLDTFSHQLLGSVAFSVPVGLGCLLLFYAWRAPVVRMLPGPYRRALLPLCELPRASVWAIVLSLGIGAWTHFLWDSCTHKNGWVAQEIAPLNAVAFTWGYRTARVSLLLWYASSFAGMIWLLLAWEKWKQAHVDGCARVPGRLVLRDTALVALLFLPIALVHHLMPRSEVVLYSVAAACGLPALALMLRTARNRDDAGEGTA